MGREKASVANLLPPLRPPPPLAPGRLLQRGGQPFLRGAGVAHQQVGIARRQLRGVRAVGRIVLVRGVHARRIRPGVSGVATVPAGRCSGASSPGLSCLRLPDPAGTDCPSGPALHHRCALRNGSGKGPAWRQSGTCSGDVAVCRDVRNVSRTRSLYERARHLPGTDHKPSSLSSTSHSGVASVSSRP